VGVPLDPDDSLAQIEADVRLIQTRAQMMPTFEKAVAQVRGKAASAGRDIRVEVDSGGRVLDLRVSESALAGGAQRLSHELLAVIRAAESDATKATLDAVGALLGADDPIVAQLRASGDTSSGTRPASGTAK
jgi:DNA-binding protein YbaB